MVQFTAKQVCTYTVVLFILNQYFCVTADGRSFPATPRKLLSLKALMLLQIIHNIVLKKCYNHRWAPTRFFSLAIRFLWKPKTAQKLLKIAKCNNSTNLLYLKAGNGGWSPFSSLLSTVDLWVPNIMHIIYLPHFLVTFYFFAKIFNFFHYTSYIFTILLFATCYLVHFCF